MTTERPNNWTIRLTYEPENADRLMSPDGRLQLLLCEACLAPEWVAVNIVSFECAACASARDEREETE